MIVRDDVQRHRHLSRALHASQQRPQHLPHEKNVARLPVSLRVRKVNETIVVRVDGPPVRAADALGRARGARAEGERKGGYEGVRVNV